MAEEKLGTGHGEWIHAPTYSTELLPRDASKNRIVPLVVELSYWLMWRPSEAI
jgi:hypothetical protein